MAFGDVWVPPDEANLSRDGLPWSLAVPLSGDTDLLGRDVEGECLRTGLAAAIAVAVDLAHSIVPIVLWGSLVVAALRCRVPAAAAGEPPERFDDSVGFFNECIAAAS